MPDPILSEVITRAEARARRLKRFFTGKPCNHGHISEREMREGKCIACLRFRHKRWFAKNLIRERAKQRIYEKQWREANPDKERGKKARWENADRERVREVWRNSRNRRIDVVRARTREHARKNAALYAERNRQWWKDHPGKQRLKSSLRVYRQGLPQWVDRNSLQAIYEACPPGFTVDHIVPLNGRTIEGYRITGLHVPWNLQYLTQKENSAKCNRMRRVDQELCENYVRTT